MNTYVKLGRYTCRHCLCDQTPQTDSPSTQNGQYRTDDVVFVLITEHHTLFLLCVSVYLSICVSVVLYVCACALTDRNKVLQAVNADNRVYGNRMTQYTGIRVSSVCVCVCVYD